MAGLLDLFQQLGLDPNGPFLGGMTPLGTPYQPPRDPLANANPIDLSQGLSPATAANSGWGGLLAPPQGGGIFPSAQAAPAPPQSMPSPFGGARPMSMADLSGLPAPPPAMPQAPMGGPSAPPAPQQAQPTAPASGPGNRSWLDPVGRLGDFFNSPDASPMLMAMASGFGGAQSLGQGIGRAAGAVTQLQPYLQKNEIQRQQVLATYQAAVRSGMDPNKAMLIAMNPEAGKEAISQLTGAKAPEAKVVKDIDGGEHIEYWNPSTQSWIRGPGSTPTAQQGGGTGQFGVAPPGPNMDVQQYRKSASEASVAEQKLLAEKAEGSVEFLQNAIPVHQKLSSGYYNNVIGPYQGYVNDYIRSPGNAVGFPTDLGRANEFKGEMTKLGTSNLKAQFGARPTQYEFQQNQASFGGAGTADASTATSMLGTRIQESYNNLNRSISLGQTKPESVPQKVAEYGVSHGLLDPKLFPNVKVAPAAAQPNLPPGVRSIHVVQ